MTKWSNLFKVVMILAIATLLAIPVIGQDDLDAIGDLGKKDSRPSGAVKTDNPNHKKLSKDEALRVRIMEIMSGARTMDDLAPISQQIVGPPLDEKEKIYQALNRMAFGATPGQVERMMDEGGWESWAMAQLDPESINDTKLEDELGSKYPWYGMTITQLHKRVADQCERETMCDRPGCANKRELYGDLPAVILHRAVKSERQFFEVMAEFWRNHFAVDQRLVSSRMVYTTTDYEENVIRKHAFGKFDDLLMASAKHPAMLEFLDNWISRKGAWNENYAREIMELHTLGADRYYNERDVLELTRALTGWTFNPSNDRFVFKPNNHEPGMKMVLGKRIPEGYNGGEYAVNMLAKHRGTATFISEKLCRYLINDHPPKALVNKIAGKFKSSNGDLKKVYEAIITSPEFMQRANYRSKFKTPFESTVSTLRAVDAQISDMRPTARLVGEMGQAIYNCPDPTGYYDQAEAWLDSGVLTRRWDYAWKLIRGNINGVAPSQKFLARVHEMGSGEKAKDALIAELIGADLGTATDKMLDDIAKTSGGSSSNTLLPVLLGSPAFQQQ